MADFKETFKKTMNENKEVERKQAEEKADRFASSVGLFFKRWWVVPISIVVGVGMAFYVPHIKGLVKDVRTKADIAVIQYNRGMGDLDALKTGSSVKSLQSNRSKYDESISKILSSFEGYQKELLSMEIKTREDNDKRNKVVTSLNELFAIPISGDPYLVRNKDWRYERSEVDPYNVTGPTFMYSMYDKDDKFMGVFFLVYNYQTDQLVLGSRMYTSEGLQSSSSNIKGIAQE